MQPTAGTAQQILDTAQPTVQSRGYNGFSDADISAAVGIRKASIHLPFPTALGNNDGNGTGKDKEMYGLQ